MSKKTIKCYDLECGFSVPHLHDVVDNEYLELDVELADDEQLCDAKESILSDLTEGKGTSLDAHLNQLCEIERELTLRENK